MKNLTAKEIEEILDRKVRNHGLNSALSFDKEIVIEIMSECTEIAIGKENTRLHDRFIEAMPVGYFDSTKEFLEMKDLIFNETFDLYEKPELK